MTTPWITPVESLRPDVQTFPPEDLIPDALIISATTKVGVVSGDQPVVRCPFIDVDDVELVPEGDEIPAAPIDSRAARTQTGAAVGVQAVAGRTPGHHHVRLGHAQRFIRGGRGWRVDVLKRPRRHTGAAQPGSAPLADSVNARPGSSARAASRCAVLRITPSRARCRIAQSCTDHPGGGADLARVVTTALLRWARATTSVKASRSCGGLRWPAEPPAARSDGSY